MGLRRRKFNEWNAPSILAVMGPQALAYGAIKYGGKQVIANQIRKMAARATMTSFYIQETGGDYMQARLPKKMQGTRLVELNEELEKCCKRALIKLSCKSRLILKQIILIGLNLQKA